MVIDKGLEGGEEPGREGDAHVELEGKGDRAEGLDDDRDKVREPRIMGGNARSSKGKHDSLVEHPDGEDGAGEPAVPLDPVPCPVPCRSARRQKGASGERKGVAEGKGSESLQCLLAPPLDSPLLEAQRHGE